VVILVVLRSYCEGIELGIFSLLTKRIMMLDFASSTLT
jgi:hypothetical protein